MASLTKLLLNSLLSLSIMTKTIELNLQLLLLIILHSPAFCQVGEWRLLQANVGISPMHMQLLHDNRVIMFDRTDFGQSNLPFPQGRCRIDPNDTALKVDCTAHSILYDIATNTFRPLMVLTDAFCSSGAVLPDGTLVQTGGYNDGERRLRTFTPCTDNTCDWIEFPNFLSERRWYASNQILPDGRIIVVGGRRQFNYEFYTTRDRYPLNFLIETRDGVAENNLYPFLHLLPDGNLFIFANTRSILLDYHRNQVIREYPEIPDGVPRSYPSSGSSVLLPLDESQGIVEAEILICGGTPRRSYERAQRGDFVRASSTCGRPKVTDPNPTWQMETMPMPRVMGDMLLLPTGDILIINGAQSGTAGWELGRDPITRPILYRPNQPPSWRLRFSVMAFSPRPRMYHSTAIFLPDARILIGGSNPHIYYNFTNVEFPTDVTLEPYSPPYLSPEYIPRRPSILSVTETVTYRQNFKVRFTVLEFLAQSVLSIRIIAPSFNTHSFSMSQRMVVLKMSGFTEEPRSSYNVGCLAPSNPQIAPPGYYLLFVVHGGTPSSGAWIKLQ